MILVQELWEDFKAEHDSGETVIAANQRLLKVLVHAELVRINMEWGSLNKSSVLCLCADVVSSLMSRWFKRRPRGGENLIVSNLQAD